MDVREGIPAVRNHGHEGDGTMQTVKAFRGNARTFLTHMFGRGLDDDRYVIERFLSKADGEIRPRRRNGASKKSRGNVFPRNCLPKHREEDPARARRDHCLHRYRHHRWRSILGRSRNGLVCERQVSLTYGRRGHAVGLRRPDVFRQDHNRGRKVHALQGSRERARMRAAAL